MLTIYLIKSNFIDHYYRQNFPPLHFRCKKFNNSSMSTEKSLVWINICRYFPGINNSNHPRISRPEHLGKRFAKNSGEENFFTLVRISIRGVFEIRVITRQCERAEISRILQIFLLWGGECQVPQKSWIFCELNFFFLKIKWRGASLKIFALELFFQNQMLFMGNDKRGKFKCKRDN